MRKAWNLNDTDIMAEGVDRLLPVYFGWGLLVPVCFSLIYGYVSHRAMQALGYQQENTVRAYLRISLPAMILFTLWCMLNFPLPVLYILAFLGKLVRLQRRNENSEKSLFLSNFAHLTTMALHLILIGFGALITGSSMNELLEEPFWRIGTIGMLLAVDNLALWRVPRWNTILEVLRTQSKSQEVRPFMVYLWFCNVFLLVDSELCSSEIQWDLLPVFLIGSTVLMEFYLFRFLRHLYTILKVQYLEEEHHRLLLQLEEKNRNAAKLRSKSVIDPMTGIFSRRYAMEQIDYLLQMKVPFSLVFIDLDHLKRINDREGHHAGDIYILRFTSEFSSFLRKSDIFARVGGDEFVVILPNCTRDTAEKRLDSIRTRLTEASGLPITFSYGITCASGKNDDSSEQVLYRADQAMYEDKQAHKR